MDEVKKIKLNIIGYDHIIFEGNADFVTLPTNLGEIGVLPGHTRMFSLLAPGDIKVKNEGKENTFPVNKGIIKIRPDEIEVLSE